MAKKIKTILKLQLPAGAATPAPPVGTALGPHGLNIGDFVNKFNTATKEMAGDIVPVEITVFEDRTYEMKFKTSPAAALLKKAAGIEKGAADPKKQKVGKVTMAQIREIAERKMVDLNANNLAAAEKIIMGTARSMGIEVAK
ncbi:50S ribosomal protein L11 [Candidatus Azambacteria bacterium RIFCSPHIGHO2_01_FULL_44_55]|uniref:Large ribosomal subunit protein uL11 n=1 Tax=Candidatus Azambacteria bacterium RIFCSPLOWO2_02_FULL_44_14 TaxID=1797306 RepID=A0A1F5CCJ6_9BACT|nr:MAG: 50S ribosomal protein L11 [Candidatus Azambacteria bacterium RIFCSPHIGHO2_02_FULL_45_18]OGD40127.1 MAG: 50S ribosomal protein L11 [Candidatus Azambacteria bacterium RIFCSPHIGHO2_01_FULL_44_55]OGD40574.1 MAG: 50S ribosomal protein L11 [Candidatus Azambacteria bacterium RIFCSPLOWO2_02_FULL_44_14]OGD49972.1 MAG: 50S ribosomal protein L11 [Candidatus Azambacteria bacterium RIFOXYD1_FULL_44_10]